MIKTLFYVRTRPLFSLLRVGSARLPQASDLRFCSEFALFTPVCHDGISAGHPDRLHLKGSAMTAYNGLRANSADLPARIVLPAYKAGRAGDGSMVGKGTAQRRYRFAYAYMLHLIADGGTYGDTRVSCGYCGQTVLVSGADVDHCLPGTDWRGNLQLMHVHCNRARKNAHVRDEDRNRARTLQAAAAGVSVPVNAVARALFTAFGRDGRTD